MSNTEWSEARERLEAHLQPKPRPTIAELEEILASEENEPILVEPDGSLSVGHSHAADIRAALDEVDRLTNAGFIYEHECEGCGLGETVVVDRADVTERTPPAVEDLELEYTKGIDSDEEIEKVDIAAIFQRLRDEESLPRPSEACADCKLPAEHRSLALEAQESRAWAAVAVDSNKAIDAYLRGLYPKLEKHYGMPVDGVRRVFNAVTQDLCEALRSTIASLRSVDDGLDDAFDVARHLDDKYSSLLSSFQPPPSQNVER